MASYIAEVVGFLLLVAFTIRYVWPPLKRLMERHEREIGASISSAQTAAETAGRELSEARAALERARTEVEVIVQRAHETSLQLRREGEQRGREEYERVVSGASSQAELERQRALEEITRQLGSVVVAATERVVTAEIDTAVQRAFIAEAIDVAEAMA